MIGLMIIAAALTLPNAPVPRRAPALDRTEMRLLAEDGAARILDTVTTSQLWEHGNREGMLPGAIAYHPAGLSAMEGAAVLGNYLLMRELNKHGHRKLAHWMTRADALGDAACGLNNVVINARGER